MALTLEEKKSVFIEALKKTYKLQYDAVQPIPYVKDRLYCVDKIFVEGGTECFRDNSWIRLNSYKEMFSGDQVQSNRCILEGEPGYGKSTLTLQLAYDWSNDIEESPLSKVEILILLKLRQLGGIPSIYRAIKVFLLSDERRLKVKDIDEIFKDCPSIFIALDGYDEYPEKDSHRGNEINQIILKRMFENFHVTLTTRYLPKLRDEATTKMFRLTGFDSRARDEYIRKAVVGDDDDSAVESTKRKLKENSILADLCEVPLIFVMFAHMAHEQKSFQNFNTVTSFFKYMIRCFHEHTRLKAQDKNVQEFNQYENEHTELDKVAFEGLARADQQLTWRREKLVRLLGKPFYDQYISIGILVEERVVIEGVMGDDCEFIIMVRFYHKLFCEWYAGHYLAFFLARNDVKVKPWIGYKPGIFYYDERDYFQEYAEDDTMEVEQFQSSDNEEMEYMQEGIEESDILNQLDPFDLQYLFRFSCGLRPEAGKKIIEYLGTRKDADKFSILCILEQVGNIDDVIKNVKEICSRDVEINEGDTALLQRSTIQLLDIASRNEIPISCVTLKQLYEQVDKDEIKLRSGQTLPKLLTVKKIHIEEEEELEQRHYGQVVIRVRVRKGRRTKKERELSEDEVMKICAYALGSKRLKEISFGHCLLPISLSRTVQAAEIINRNIKVTWCRYGYCFNFQSGLWEVDDINTVKRLCSSEVEIWNTDSELLQRCTILLLENACNNAIAISCVTLDQSFEQVDKDEIRLRSGQTLPKLLTVEKIHIKKKEEEEEEERQLSEDEVMKICAYALGSKRLREISFGHCLLPLSLSRTVQAAEIINRNIKVTWCRYGYCFNFQSGLWEVDDVNTVRRLCLNQVNIRNTDSELLQRCTILLLENASYHDIPIYSVWLGGCSPRVSESGLTPQSGLISQSGLILQSGLSLSILSSLQRLEINDYLRRLTTKEFVSILGYSSHCTSLKELKFCNYLLPESIPVRLIPPLLKSRKVKVWNNVPFRGYHRLNLTTGLWQRCDGLGNLP